MKAPAKFVRSCMVVFLTAMVPLPPAFGWGAEGHRIINRVAMATLPANMPQFLRIPMAAQEVEYLGPEPDRWRGSTAADLRTASAPEHFIDLEMADLAAPAGLPAQRYEFLRDLQRARSRYQDMAWQLTPQHVGLLPWQVEEDFERLRVDMAAYRRRVAEHRPTDGVELAILYDAGLLGHYVGDGSQPLHTTVDYNGWVEEENPEGFTRSRGIHSKFETEFVLNTMHAAEVEALVPAQPRILDSPFQDFVEYLRRTHGQVAEVYRLQKRGGFTGDGTAESRGFTAARLAAGAAMLRDMVATAWAQSALN